MPLQLSLIPLAGFTGLMVTAAFEDFRRFVIPNRLTLALCLLWPFHVASGVTLTAFLGAIGCAVAVFIGGALLFSRGLVGGGDVKLLAAATLWAGPYDTPALLIGTGLVGGLLALFLLTPAGALVIAGRAPAGADGEPHKTPMPYGVAIAAAALIVTIPPYFG
jgi:prepilin peptidase CpaA